MIVGLLPIVIRISRRRAFNEVADALPGVTDRVLGVLPRQAGHAFDAIPIAHQLRFRLFERLAFVTSVSIDAVTIGGTILDWQPTAAEPGSSAQPDVRHPQLPR